MLKFASLVFAVTLVAFKAKETSGTPISSALRVSGVSKETPRATEYVAGFVLYRIKNNALQYLLIKKKGENDWTPPKGRLEVSEIEMVAAVRETVEETSIYPTKYIIHDFHYNFQYTTNSGDKKMVELWPAYLQTPDHTIIIDPNENDTYEWLTFPRASEIVKRQYRDAFIVMHEYICIRQDKC